jgi:hypothetical protein
MKDEVFVTADGAGGHVEHVGRPLHVDGSIHCWRREVRETLAGFEVYDVRFLGLAALCTLTRAMRAKAKPLPR